MFKALGNFDRRYAGKVLENLEKGGGDPQSVRAMLTTLPLGEKAEYAADANRMSAIGERVAIGGIKAVNAGYRYGLPAAGVTLAGKALLDLTGAYEQQTTGTIMP